MARRKKRRGKKGRERERESEKKEKRKKKEERSCVGERKGRIGWNKEGRLMAREKRANARRVWELEVAVG